MRIIQNSSAYKVCHGCCSIVVRQVTICPHCHAYRFDHEGVAAHAVKLMEREPTTWSDEIEEDAA
jgi:hypothetical protein